MPGPPFRNRESIRRQGTPWLPCHDNLKGESIRAMFSPLRFQGFGTCLNAERSLLHRNQKMLPILDIVRVPDKGTDWQLSGCLWFLFQLETHLFRQTIPFQAIDPLVRQDAVLPRSYTPARSWDDMIDVAFLGASFLPVYWQWPPSRSQIPLAESLGRRFGTLL